MSKENSGAVRSHSQEREWLLRLGDGNIVESVRQIIRLFKGDSSGESNFAKSQESKKKVVLVSED